MKVYIKNLLVHLIIFCFSLECIARIDTYVRSRFRNSSLSAIQEQDDMGLKGIRYGRWRDIALNKYGFNDSDDYEKDKKTRAVRIMCLGDSVTFGVFTYPHNWPNFLEDMLKSEGIDAEVINAATPGVTYSQIVKRFEAEYIEFRPDILIIYKDFISYMAKPADSEVLNKNSILGKILGKSVFVKRLFGKESPDPYKRLLAQRKKMKIKKISEDISEEGLAEYRKDLERLIQVCKTNNITLVLAPYTILADEGNKDKFINHVYACLCFYPSLSPEALIKGISLFNAVTSEVAKKENVLYIDTSKGLEHDEINFKDNLHLDVAGAKQLARNYSEILTDVIKRKILTKQNKTADVSRDESYQVRESRRF